MFYFNLAIFTYHIFGTSGIPLPNLWFFLTIGGKKERLAAESEARAQTRNGGGGGALKNIAGVD